MHLVSGQSPLRGISREVNRSHSKGQGSSPPSRTDFRRRRSRWHRSTRCTAKQWRGGREASIDQPQGSIAERGGCLDLLAYFRVPRPKRAPCHVAVFQLLRDMSPRTQETSELDGSSQNISYTRVPVRHENAPYHCVSGTSKVIATVRVHEVIRWVGQFTHGTTLPSDALPRPAKCPCNDYIYMQPPTFARLRDNSQLPSFRCWLEFIRLAFLSCRTRTSLQ